MNTPFASTKSAVYIGVRHVVPGRSAQRRRLRADHIKEAKGTFLHAEYPKPVAGAAAECSQRVVETVLGALGRALPERAYAGPFGTAGNFSLGGYDPSTSAITSCTTSVAAATAGTGRVMATPTPARPSRSPRRSPSRCSSAHYPVLFEQAALREDSAGAGKFRGGFGIQYRVKLRRGEAAAAFMMDHGRFPPYALEGGKTGAMTEIRVSQGGQVTSRRMCPRERATRWRPATGST